MKKRIIFVLMAGTIFATGCGNGQNKNTESETAVVASQENDAGGEQGQNGQENPDGADASGKSDESGSGAQDGRSGENGGLRGGNGGAGGGKGRPDGGAGGNGGGNGGSGNGGSGNGGSGGDNGGAGGSGGPRGGKGGKNGRPGGGAQSAPETYSAVAEYSEDTSVSSKSFSSTGTDENTIHVLRGAAVTLKDITLSRTSGDSTGGDQSSFYGVGAGILVSDGTLSISDSTITTDAAGGAGVFAYNKGNATVTNTKITTTQDTSGGIHVAGGGTLTAENLTVETSGASSAAIRSDRGGGTLTVKGGTYTSHGSGSPAVYSTASLTISDAALTATGAEAACIEGLNSIKLTNCSLSGNIPENEQNDCDWTVILYQSMSGDSEIGNSTFDMSGGSLTSKNGGLFYTTNTESTFTLKNVSITPSDSNDFFLKATGNSNKRGWGTSGANGADCNFTADTQKMEGNIIWDSISTLDLTMKNSSTWSGAFVQDETAAGNGGGGYASLTIDGSSSWIVTADSTLTTLKCKGTITGADNKSVTIKKSDGTVLEKGAGAYTITVDTYEK